MLLTPIYWFAVTAQLKAFIDRLDALWHWERGFLAGKPAGAVLVYMDATPEASGAVHAMASLEHLFRCLGADFRGFACGTAGEVGEAERNPRLLRTSGTWPSTWPNDPGPARTARDHLAFLFSSSMIRSFSARVLA